MIRVLLVEDDAPLRDLARRYLEIGGDIMAEVSPTAEEALEQVRAREFDAIISDYLLPGMDGVSLLREVREAGNPIPFIIFTGRGTEDVAIDALNSGADFYIRKGGDPRIHFGQLRNMVLLSAGRRKAQEALAQSIKRLSDIIDAIPDATFAIDRSGRIVAWNRAMEELTGAGPGEMLGREDHAYAVRFHGFSRPMLIDLIFAPDEEVMRHGFHDIRRPGRAVSAGIQVTCGGRERAFRMTATPLYDEKGGVAGAIEIIRDVSGSTRAGEELSRKAALLGTIMNGSPCGIAILDDRFRILEANERFRRIFPEAGMPGVSSLKGILSRVQECLPGGVSPGHDTRMRGRDGKEISLRIDRIGSGGSPGYVIHAQPVTDCPSPGDEGMAGIPLGK